MRQTMDKFHAQAMELIDRLAAEPSYADLKDLFGAIKEADHSSQDGIEEQRAVLKN